MLTQHQARVGPARALSDADLIGRSLAEPACFGEIFDRHADEILRYAHARLGPDLAQDVVAETFLAAFARRDRYDTTRADARPWLYGIAVRQIGRHRRAAARQLRLLRAVEPFLMPFAEDPSDTIENAITYLRGQGLVKVGNKLIIATDILVQDRLVDSVQLRTVR